MAVSLLRLCLCCIYRDSGLTPCTPECPQSLAGSYPQELCMEKVLEHLIESLLLCIFFQDLLQKYAYVIDLSVCWQKVDGLEVRMEMGIGDTLRTPISHHPLQCSLLRHHLTLVVSSLLWCSSRTCRAAWRLACGSSSSSLIGPRQ